MSAQDQHAMHVLVALERGEAAGRDFEVAQFAGHLGIGEQHLARDGLVERALVFLVGPHHDALPMEVVRRGAVRHALELLRSTMRSGLRLRHIGSP